MSARTIVLMYHRIADERHDPFALAVDPDAFDRQLAAIRRRAEIIPFGDVLTRGSGPRVAITLDDGYADGAHAALDVLSTHDAPATFFVVSDAVGSPTPLWQLRLEHMFRRDPRGETVTFHVRGHAFSASVHSPQARLRATRFVHTHLQARRLEEIKSTLHELDAQFHPGRPDDRRMLSADEVRTLAAHRLATLGAHTRTHPWLATLDRDEQFDELAGSRSRLEQMTGAHVDLLAYPFGYYTAYNRITVRAARRAGFRLACTTREAPLIWGTSRYRIPRYAVIDRMSETFEQRLDRWLDR